jgi:hypothetical protein
MRTRTTAFLVALAGILGGVCGACGPGDDANTLQDCDKNGNCPAGYECRPSDNKCVKRGATGPDAAPVVTPDAAPVVTPDARALPDATPAAPDAAPAAPDAAPPPDAPPAQANLTLGVTGSGSGTISIVGQSYACTSPTCTKAVDIGTELTLLATPANSTRLVSWTGDCAGTNSTATVKVDGPKSCSATFAKRLTVSVATTGGTSTVGIASSSAAAQCTTTACVVDLGDPVTLTPKLAAADRFVGWTGAGCTGFGLTTPLELRAAVDSSCSAHFVDAASTTAPALGALWRSPTGWLNAAGASPSMAIRPVTGALFECRTGRTRNKPDAPSNIANMTFSPCDGGDGSKPTVVARPVAVDPNGTYRTEVRMRILDYVSASTTSAEYYAHDTLDHAAECPSSFTDAQLVAAAIKPAWNQGTLTDTGAFGVMTALDSPFVQVPFVSSAFNVWAKVGDPTPPTPDLIKVLSLRHTFTMSGNFLVVRRRFESSRRKTLEPVSSCVNGFQFGWNKFMIYKKRFGPTDPREARRRVDCVGLVINSAGNGTCVQKDVTGALVPAIYSYTAWEKLVDIDNFSPKHRGTCTLSPARCGFELPE